MFSRVGCTIIIIFLEKQQGVGWRGVMCRGVYVFVCVEGAGIVKGHTQLLD